MKKSGKREQQKSGKGRRRKSGKRKLKKPGKGSSGKLRVGDNIILPQAPAKKKSSAKTIPGSGGRGEKSRIVETGDRAVLRESTDDDHALHESDIVATVGNSTAEETAILDVPSFRGRLSTELVETFEEDIIGELNGINEEILEVHEQVIADLQIVFNRIAGTKFDEAKKAEIIGMIQKTMKRLNALVVCPKSGKKGILRLKQAGRSKKKTIEIQVHDGKKRTSYFSSMAFPEVTIVEADQNPEE